MCARYCFPGIGLAASVAGVSEITDPMLCAAEVESAIRRSLLLSRRGLLMTADTSSRIGTPPPSRASTR